MNSPFVLDAWGLLAFLLREEPAASRIKQLLQDAQNRSTQLFLSVINLGEVYYQVGRRRGMAEADDTLEEIRLLPLTILPASENAVFTAARIKMAFSISYADAFAASATEQLNATLVTGDPQLLQLQGRVKIEKLSRIK